MIDNNEVGKRIGAYLKLTGRKIIWFAEQMHWTNEKASSILSGKRRIEVIEFFKACKVLGVPYDQFITDADFGD